MATELNDSHDRHAAISPSMWMRRDRLERQFLDRVRAMAGLHLAAGDGVEGAAYELVDELREEGLRCEHMLLALKALLKRSRGRAVHAHQGDRAALYHLLLQAPGHPGRDRALSFPGSRR